MSKQKVVKGYKVFNPDWTCMGFQYQVGKCYEIPEKPVVCERGFHFCKNLLDCYEHYRFDENNKVAEVTAYGDIDIDEYEKKYCTNKIKIEKELNWNEVLNMVNTGKNCTGFRNTGDWNTGNYNTGYYNTGYYNTGDRNTGDCNTGNCNTGDYNTGDRNTGYCNTGDCNTGDCNTGDRNTGNRNTGYCNTGDYNTGYRNTGNRNTGDCNTGDYNTGNYNTGDWNTGNWNTGCFNTVEQKIFLFNKLSDWTMKDWINSEARSIFYDIRISPVQKINKKDMTEKEKEQHPEYQTTGFYLKELRSEEIAEERQKYWNQLSQKQKDIVMAIPNFDKEIFKEITGIDVDKGVMKHEKDC